MQFAQQCVDLHINKHAFSVDCVHVILPNMHFIAWIHLTDIPDLIYS